MDWGDLESLLYIACQPNCGKVASSKFVDDNIPGVAECVTNVDGGLEGQLYEEGQYRQVVWNEEIAGVVSQTAGR